MRMHVTVLGFTSLGAELNRATYVLPFNNPLDVDHTYMILWISELSLYI
jgi:hypothetical protein